MKTMRAIYQIIIQFCCMLKVISGVSDSAILQNESYMQYQKHLTYLSTGTKVENLPCLFAPGLAVGNRNRELQCCNETVKAYENGWWNMSLPVTRYLQTLEAWNCPRFQEECSQRTFVFNNFTSLIYDYFCDYNSFMQKCFEDVNKTMTWALHRQGSAFPSDSSQNRVLNKSVLFIEQNYRNNSLKWRSLIENFNYSALTIEELLMPCLQVAQYDKEKSRSIHFQEAITTHLPTCEIIWCGFAENVYDDFTISTWTCMPFKCRVKIIIIIVLCSILALAVVILNLIVITAIVKDPIVHDKRGKVKKGILQNSQGIYKLSLAVADTLVGVIVLPTCIINLIKQVWTQHTFGKDTPVRGYETINGSFASNWTILNISEIPLYFENTYSQTYGKAVGFVTSISIFVSVFTLAGAGFDRFYVLHKQNPCKNTLFKVACRVCILAWMVAILIATFPVFLPDTRYALTLYYLFVSYGSYSVALYIIGLILPLLIVWFINISLFLTIKRKFMKTNEILKKTYSPKRAQRKQKEPKNAEEQLACTLFIMVSVFTFNTLPMLFLLVCSLFIPSLKTTDLENFNADSIVTYNTVLFIAIVLLLGNSLCNFFIYSARSSLFRLKVKQIYKNFLTKRQLDEGLNPKRKRISSLPSLSIYLGKKRKKSSLPTSETNVGCGSPTFVDEEKLSDVFPSPPTKPSQITDKAIIWRDFKNQAATSGETESKQDGRQLKDFVVEDSIFASFDDSNLRSLCDSVIEKIEEDFKGASHK